MDEVKTLRDVIAEHGDEAFPRPIYCGMYPTTSRAKKAACSAPPVRWEDHAAFAANAFGIAWFVAVSSGVPADSGGEKANILTPRMFREAGWYDEEGANRAFESHIAISNIPDPRTPLKETREIFAPLRVKLFSRKDGQGRYVVPASLDAFKNVEGLDFVGFVWIPKWVWRMWHKWRTPVSLGVIANATFMNYHERLAANSSEPPIITNRHLSEPYRMHRQAVKRILYGAPPADKPGVSPIPQELRQFWESIPRTGFRLSDKKVVIDTEIGKVETSGVEFFAAWRESVMRTITTLRVDGAEVSI